MSPAATIKPDAGALGRRHASFDRRLVTTTPALCGTILPSDQSRLGFRDSLIQCRTGYFCAASSNYWGCLPYAGGGTYYTTCLDKSATCVGFACPPNAIIWLAGSLTCFSAETSNIAADKNLSRSDIYSTVCETYIFGSSFTAYGCGTAAVSLNAVPLSLTQYTPTTSSTSTASASTTPTTPSQTSSPTSSLAIQVTSSTSQLAGPNNLLTTSSLPSPSPSNPPSSLSTEVKAGIGVSVSFGALLIAAVLIIIFRKILYKKLKSPRQEIPELSNTTRKNAQSNLSNGTQQDPAELTAPFTTQINPRQQHPTQNYVLYELSDPQEVAHELPVEVISPQGTKDR